MAKTDLGNAVGISFQQIQKYENGSNRVGASRLHQIAHALGVTPEFFFEEETKVGVRGAEDLAVIDDFILLARRHCAITSIHQDYRCEDATQYGLVGL